MKISELGAANHQGGPFSMVIFVGQSPATGRREMDTAAFAVEAGIEETHWWFVGRRRLFAAELHKAGVDRTDRVLDIGTGTGANLRLLRDLGFSDVTGVDTSKEAIGYCASKGLGTVRKGSICALPFADGTFDLVLA